VVLASAQGFIYGLAASAGPGGDLYFTSWDLAPRITDEAFRFHSGVPTA